MTKTQMIRICFYTLCIYYSINLKGSQRVMLFGKTIDWFPTEIEIKSPISRILTYGLKHYIVHKDTKVRPNTIPLRLTIISLY